ncbi:hypothetical protein FACS1894208_09400 [Clostridia bacterium]|nr:hypothetical protein FACS1894208_09400 [Clostridia bacterium]
MPTTIHNLKILPKFFEPVRSGAKPFEVRKNDRDYKVGDTVKLWEYDPDTQAYSGLVINAKITYILPGGDYGIHADYCVLGLSNPIAQDWSECPYWSGNQCTGTGACHCVHIRPLAKLTQSFKVANSRN